MYLNHLEDMEKINRKIKADSLANELKLTRENNSNELKLYKLDIKLKRDSIGLLARELSVKSDSLRLISKLSIEETKRHKSTEKRLETELNNQRKTSIALSDDLKRVELALANERIKADKEKNKTDRNADDNKRKVDNTAKRNESVPVKVQILFGLAILGALAVGILIGKIIK